jgi:HD domain
LRILYRARQFWHALNATPTSEDLALACSVLTPAQMTAFYRLQPSEQHHAISVLRKLKAQGETHPDLLVAALLHDVGKCQARLQPWDRALIVLAQAIAPQKAKQWATESDKALTKRRKGWRRAFFVAQDHPEWGAHIARGAGASPLVEALIRRHQEASGQPAQSLEDRLLLKLQLADDDS